MPNKYGISDHYFNIFKDLKSDFISNINFVKNFGNNDFAFLVTKDDKVFGLKLSRSESSANIMCINELNDKLIIDINKLTTGRPYITLSKDGQCYSFGYNKFRSARDGLQLVWTKPSLFLEFNHKIIDVKSGAQHNLLLSETGRVFVIGSNRSGQCGLPSNLKKLMQPFELIAFNNQKVKAIACRSSHSLALTETGSVYFWGNTKSSQESEVSQIFWTPTKIKFNKNTNNIKIEKICCGYAHSLMLSDKAIIYAFDSNRNGEIGSFNDYGRNAIEIISSTKFVDIGSHYRSKISFALSVNGFCYVLGNLKLNDEMDINRIPIETEYKAIEDTFGHYSEGLITYKPLYFKTISKIKDRIAQRNNRIFNKEEFSDFRFKINDKLIYVSKLYIMSQSKHFKTMFSQKWLKSRTNELEIKEYSYEVFYAYIKYLYTNCIDVKPEDAIPLYDLANSYLIDEEERNELQFIK
jgi:RCC1 and BTB domain-containing protein